MSMPISAGEYDQGWEDLWDDMKIYGPFARHLRRIVFSLLEPLHFSSVLDVGCGQGTFLLELSSKYPNLHIFGTEYSHRAIEIVQERIPWGNFKFLDLSKGTIPGRFDLVCCMEILEHIEDDVTAINNLVAMTDRYLLVTAPQGRMRKIELNYGHVRNYAPGELPTKLFNAGLTIIKKIKWGYPFYSPFYRDLINLIKGVGTTGKFRLYKKYISKLIYTLFLCNSWNRGDELVILAENQK
jgi:SAM-dependent methyltransferase